MSDKNHADAQAGRTSKDCTGAFGNTYRQVLPTLQNEAAAKLDELLTPIEYPQNSEKINKLQEQQDRGNIYAPSVR